MAQQDRTTPTESAGRRARAEIVDALPVTERRMELAGMTTAVLEGGEGPPIVLLHGQGEFGAVWFAVIAELCERHRVIVPDLPDHGATKANDVKLDTGAVLAWLDELIDRTCRSKPVLVGHLLGGSIAARYAVEHSDRIAHLVLLDSMGLGWFRPSPKFAVPLVGFIARPSDRSRDRLFAQCFLDTDRVEKATGSVWGALQEYAVDCARDPGMQAALKRLMPRLGLPPIAAGDLERISAPTTLIHGRHDLQVKLKTAEAAAARYGWPLHVIEDCRDDPAAEQPEALLEALSDALGTSEEEQR
jgi:pimeloyl-ACP methyl ester carboxylesterase